MKRILLAAVVICTAQFADAQTKTDSLPHAIEKKMEKDGFITLQGGQVMMVKDSKAEKLEKDKTLTDGTVVMVNGMIKKADGTSLQMKEGDRIYLDGGMSLSRKDTEPMN
jgi:opacity protein-like surface antigen